MNMGFVLLFVVHALIIVYLLLSLFIQNKQKAFLKVNLIKFFLFLSTLWSLDFYLYFYVLTAILIIESIFLVIIFFFFKLTPNFILTINIDKEKIYGKVTKVLNNLFCKYNINDNKIDIEHVGLFILKKISRFCIVSLEPVNNSEKTTLIYSNIIKYFKNTEF